MEYWGLRGVVSSVLAFGGLEFFPEASANAGPNSAKQRQLGQT